MFRCRFAGLFSAILATALGGCAHTPSTPPPSVSGFGPACPCDRQPALPRGKIIPTPAPPIAGQPPAGQVVDPRYYPPTDQAWKPLPNAGKQNPPEVRLLPPEVGETQTKDANILPVDIPQFQIARKQVASGQKPFPEGLDWLKEKGYRTILHVRQPGEDDTNTRRLITAKGFRYLSLEVSPLTLNRDILDEFNRIVTDPANLPLFAYDRDSSLLGGLWYLHFRIHEGADADRAAIEAGRLGLNIDASGGEHKEMWLRIQKLLAPPMNKTSIRPARDRTASWTKPLR